jgi:transcriptional repressor NrdR
VRCPYCLHPESRVSDSRVADDGSFTRRRRECEKCHKRFTTFERYEESTLVVVKKGGTRERFDRNKVLAGLIKACEKRPVTLEQMQYEAQTIESSLRQRGDAEFKTDVVGQLVMDSLIRLDGVAYVRFASVYKEFKDISLFAEELKILERMQAAMGKPETEA